MHNASKLEMTKVLHAIVSVALVLVLSLAMVPVASIAEVSTAFAADDGSSSAQQAQDASGCGADADDVDSLDGEASASADACRTDDSGDSNDSDPDAFGSDLLVGSDGDGADSGVSLVSLDAEEDGEGDLSWMNSDRFVDGELISSSKARSGTGSSTFMKFSRGHHQASDALCGIDVSEWQGNIDWAKVKAAGIDFVIIRSSYGFTYEDKCFIQNVKGCLQYSIPFGVYHYARAANAEEATSEANFVKRRLAAAGVTASNISYPIYYDIENTGDPNYRSLGSGVVKTIATTFISSMNASGYKAGVYSSTSWWQSSGPCSQLNGLEYRWIAEYNTSSGLSYSGFGSGGDALKNNGKGIWQFSSAGVVNGIPDNTVDLNYSYFTKLDVSATARIDSINRTSGTFRVFIGDVSVSRTVSSVKVALWCSSTGGQDDLRWYPAARLSDGSYYICASVRDHKYQLGTYVAHAYFYSSDGQVVQPAGARASATIDLGEVSVSRSMASGNLAAYLAMSGGELNLASSVRVAVWTTRNGQDDLRWYAASRSGSAWRATADIRNHREAGVYAMHVYGVVNGVSRCLHMSTFTLASYGRPASVAASLNADETVFCAAGRGGALDDASSASFAVWSAAGGQDDLRWYGASHMSDGSWAMNASVSNHRTAGLYHVHVYANVGGKLSYVGQATFTVHTPSATGLRMFQLSESAGTFTVYADGVSGAPVAGVRVAVWCTANGQDDLRWYDTVSLRGSYTFGAFMSNHKGQTGLYVADVYVTMANGIQVFAGRTTANLRMG